MTLTRTAPPADPAPPPQRHKISIHAEVIAYSESMALRRLATALKDSASAQRSTLPSHIDEFDIQIDARPCAGRRQSRIEEQSQYKEHRMFQGGAARPR